MFDDRSARDKSKSRIVLVSADDDFVQTARSVLDANSTAEFSVQSDLNGRAVEREGCDAAVLIVDIGAIEQQEQRLLELGQLMARIGSELPVITVVDAFNEVAARKLVQMRVADILVKPVAAIELLRACARVTRIGREESQIHTFLPVAGGVGTTTLAIQSAFTLLGAKIRPNASTCLIDLNFNRGGCADYLDIEPRLNLKEIELNPERLDQQLLEGMLSQHKSGLAVIAAPGLPTEPTSVTPNIVMGLLNLVCQCFEQIVIDMPNAWHSWTDNIVLGSNRLFLVSEATVPGVRKAQQLVQALSAKLGPRPQPNVVINRFQHRLFSPGLRRADLERALGGAFACTIPNNHSIVSEAIDRGVPINDIRKNSDVAIAIKRLIVPRRPKLNALAQSIGRLPTLIGRGDNMNPKSLAS
jgi:pilus assembly protein CpaE